MVEATLHTEQTWTYRDLGDGRLAVTHMDPQGYGDPTQGVAAIRELDGAWRVITTVTSNPPIHCFDAARENGGRLWLVGAADVGGNASAFAWYSDDDGTTWTGEQVATSTTGYCRACALTVLAGTVTAFVSDPFDSTATGVYVRSSGSWSKVADQALEQVCDTDLVAWGIGNVKNSGQRGSSYLLAYGADASSQPDNAQVYDLTIGSDGKLYVLTDTAIIRRWDVTSWITICSVDPDARCFALDLGRGLVLVGTNSATVIASQLPS